MKVKRNKVYISDSLFYLDLSTMISKDFKEGLDSSWITQVFVKPQKPFPKDINMKDLEEENWLN